MTATSNTYVPSITDLLSDEDTLKKYCKALQENLLKAVLLGQSDEVFIELSFSGSGDSGNWDDQHENPLVQHLFNFLMEKKVNWDWYNNDGGGGSITWDIKENVIEISGYWNETVSTDADGSLINMDDLSEVSEPEEEEAS